jgi:hypothetical protein
MCLQTLLSEYGFTLPFSQPTLDSTSAQWDGNPYAEVNVDSLVEARLLLEEDDDDLHREKVQLLQDHGYWK